VTKRGPGRPPTWDLADFEEDLLRWIADGKNLRVWCREPGRPSWHTVYRWKHENEDFARRLAHARDLGHDAMAHELILLVEQPVATYDVTDAKGNVVAERMDPVDVQRRRLEVDAKLKLLACWSNRYSDRVRVGGDADAPAIKMTDDERTARLQALVAEALANKERGVKPGEDE